VAIVCVALASAAAMCFGQAILIPITEVGSVAAALGWLAACSSWYRMQRSLSKRIVAGIGGMIAAAMVLMKVLPFVPGHFSRYEWLAFGCWVVAGMVVKNRTAAPQRGRAAAI
jgi:uncharacterized membrane protein YcjF (UPF0283 family)